jgi:hypothetical protein
MDPLLESPDRIDRGEYDEIDVDVFRAFVYFMLLSFYFSVGLYEPGDKTDGISPEMGVARVSGVLRRGGGDKNRVV